MTSLARRTSRDPFGPEPEPFEPPVNFEAEQALLGAILASNNAFDRVAGRLLDSEFADAAHGRIYAAIAKLIESGQQANAITLKGYFERDEGLSEVGGAAYLAKLQALSVAIINIDDYARTIRDCYTRRKLMDVAQEVYESAASQDLEADGAAIADRAMQELTAIGLQAATGQNRTARTMAEVRVSAMARLELNIKRRYETGAAGLTTGLADLDERIGGLMPGELNIIAARPSMGKTALAEGIAWANARGGEKARKAQVKPEDLRRTLFISYEMDAEQLLFREASRITGIPSSLIRRADLSASEFGDIEHALRELDHLPMFLEHGVAKRLGAIQARARHAQRRGGLDLLIVDYLQLMEGESTGRSFNRNLDLGTITQGLKSLAVQLQIPVVVLSQLSRENEKRENRRPQLSDLRDSGAIEQDADVVMFVHREEYYLKGESPARRGNETSEAFSRRIQAFDEALEAARGRGEIIVAKNRNDVTATVNVGWDGRHTRFYDLHADHAPDFDPKQRDLL